MLVSRTLKAHALLLLVTLIWGSTFVLIKNALEDISPLLFNAVRMTLAAVALLVVYHGQMRKLTARAARAGIVVGIALWGGYEFQTTGLTLTTPSKSAFVTGLSVVLVPLFLAIGWRRMVNLWTGLGAGAAFAGLYLLAIPADSGFGSMNKGDLITLGCAVSFALQIIAVGWATAKHSFQQIATVQAVTCAILNAFAAPLLEKPHVIWSPTVIGAIVVTGLLCTSLGFSVQAWAQRFTPPSHTALIFSLEPVFAWMTSYIVLGERLGFRAGAGALMILAGVLLSELKGNNKKMGEPAEEPADVMA